MNEEFANLQIQDGNLQFEVDASLLFQLGEQLVTRRSIALSELIKNAYDADATCVTVALKDVTHEGGTIIVSDDGIGMTLYDVKQRWMRIATDDKIRHPRSPRFQRFRTGAKGIGRFAARRLSNKLKLHSVAKYEDGLKRRIIVDFDWYQFERGKTLSEVYVPYEINIVPDATPTGVTLYLQDIREVWEEDDLADLRRDLFTLASPFPRDTLNGDYEGRDPGFKLMMESPEFPEYAGELGEQFLDLAWGTLTGIVSEDGKASYHLEIRASTESLDYLPEAEVFDKLPQANFVIYYLVYRSEYFADSDFTVRQAQRKGREQGGVRIYLDGFRVFPYGDPAEDWLRLNDVRAGRNQRLVTPTGILRKEEESIPGRPWLLTPGNNQVFGAVYISQLQHPEIIPNVSRERLVENEAFNQLRYFVQLGVYWMTIQYARVTVGVREARRTPVRTGVSEIIQKAEIKVSEVAELPAEPKQEILRVLEHARQTAVEEVEDHISEISMLRVLSSTGTTVSMVNHQLRAVLDGMRMIYIDLLELKPFVYAEHIGNFEKIIQRIQNWRETVKQQVSQLGFLLGLEARTQRRRLAIRELVDNVVTPLSRYMSDYGIEFENNVPANLKSPPVFEAELYSVLLHVFTNALKAVRERQLSRIAIKASEVEGGIRIWVLDTGVGIPIDKREEVFKPFVTTSAPDPILNVGTGLGLKIVRDTLTTYEGTAQFIDTVEPWKTCLEIFIPG